MSIAFAFFAFKHEVTQVFLKETHFFPNVEDSCILLQLQMYCCKILANILENKKNKSLIIFYHRSTRKGIPFVFGQLIL